MFKIVHMLAHCHIIMAIRFNIDVKTNHKVIAENGVKTEHYPFLLKKNTAFLSMMVEVFSLPKQGLSNEAQF